MQELTKEDFKMMAKQREKAKRDQNAKQAITTFGEPVMPSSVSFDAPVKVTCIHYKVSVALNTFPLKDWVVPCHFPGKLKLVYSSCL